MNGGPSRTSRRAILTTASTGVIAAACAPGTTGTQAPASGIKSGVKVSFAFSTAADQQAVMTRAAAAVPQKWPGLTAEFINTQGQNHIDKITTSMAGGTPIDVFTLNPGEMVPFADKGQVRGIDDLIRRDKYDVSDFFEKCYGQYKWKGKNHALPRGFGNQDIYFSTSQWDAAEIKRPSYDWNAKDWTTQEFLDATLRLSRLPGSAGSTGAGVWGWNQGRGLRQWAPWVWIFGGDILNKEGTTCILDQAPAVEGLQFLHDLMHKHKVMPTTTVNTMTTMGNGQLGMAMGIPAEIGRFRAIQGLSFDVAPMPRQVTRMTSGGGIAWHMATNTPHVNEAWEIQKWVASPEVQTWECEVGGTAPPRKSVIKNPCFNDRTSQPKGLDVFLQAPEFVHTDPQAVGWQEAEEVVIAGLASLWDGSRTARQIMQDVVPQVNRILKERATSK